MQSRIGAAALVLVTALAAAPPGNAQGFKPARTVELVVHTGPGGGNDLLARAIAAMAEKEKLLPVRLQVVNKPGGSGNLALAYLAGRRGDSHAIGLFTSSMLTTSLVSAEARVSLRDLAPIARLVAEPALVAVKADAPYRTLGDFVSAAKNAPGQLRQSGGSITSRDNVLRQLLQKHTGAQWAFISFPGGGERLAALLGGHVNLMVIEPEEAGEHIRAGNLRALAQVSERRLPGYPSVPTLKESGFDVPLVPQIRGVVAPPGIPAANVTYWEDLLRRLTRTAAWRKYLDDNQFEEAFQIGPELAASLDELNGRLREILRAAGVKTVR